MHKMNKRSLPFLFLLIPLFKLCSAQDTPQDYVNAHNAARAEMGIGPVTWDEAVAAYAQSYANQRKADCELIHSEGPYGENIFQGWGMDFGAIDVLNEWMTEKQYYDYDSNSCAEGQTCLHYTQIVWSDSTNIGCAKVECDTGSIFVTCNYNPPGNDLSQRPY